MEKVRQNYNKSPARSQILHVCEHHIKIIFKNGNIFIFYLMTGADHVEKNGVIHLKRIFKYKKQH